MNLVRICVDMICLDYQTNRVVVFVECGSLHLYRMTRDVYIRTYTYTQYIHINTLHVLGLQ